MGLTEKIKNMGMNVGLASGLVVLTSGCDTMSDKQILGLALGTVAPFGHTLPSQQAAGFLGGALVSSDNADRSRSQVNVNISTPNQGYAAQQTVSLDSFPYGMTPQSVFNTSQFGYTFITICDYFKDIDNDNRDSLQECFGRRAVRNSQEEFTIYYSFGKSATSLREVIYNKTGEEVYSNNFGNGELFGSHTKMSAGDLGAGRYNLVVYGQIPAGKNLIPGWKPRGKEGVEYIIGNKEFIILDLDEASKRGENEKKESE